MADSSPYKPVTLYDGISTFTNGMNTGLSPLLLSKETLAYASNLTVRNGFAQDRPGYTNRLTIVYPSDEVQTAIEQGLFQGAGYYQPDSGSQSIFASIAGRLFQFTIVEDTVTVTERTVPGDPNPATTTQAWIWQAENYLIVNDGISLPIFFDGTSSRRSYGPSVLLATVTDLVPSGNDVPPIGTSAVYQLSGTWPGPYNVPVLFNGEYYQPIENSGGYVVNLTSLYSITGEVININDNVQTIPVNAVVFCKTPIRTGMV